MAPTKMDFHCRVLGLSSNPSRDEIKSAYKALALQWHPDRHNADKEHAKDKFIEVNSAYQALLRVTPNSPQVPRPPSSAASSSDSVPESDFYFQSADGSASSQTSFTPSSPRSTSSRASSHKDLSETTPKAKHSKSTKKSHHSGSSHRSETSESHRPESHRSESHHSSRHSESGRSRHSDKRSEKDDHHSEKSSHRSEKHGHHSHSTKSHRSSKHHHHHHHSHHHREHHHKHSKSDRGTKSIEEEDDEDDKAPETKPPTIGIPLQPSRSPGSHTSDWIFPLPLTLEELHSGTSYRFQITRQIQGSPSASAESLGSSSASDSSSSTIHIDLEIPPGGYKNGTQIRFEGIGNQRKSDGSFQDIVFIVQEVLHDRFARIKDDLVARIELAWDQDMLKENVISIEGLDGEDIAIPIPASPDSDRETRIPKAGMPIRNSEGRTIGRGDLIISWEFVLPPKSPGGSRSKWQAFKAAAFPWQQHKPIV